MMTNRLSNHTAQTGGNIPNGVFIIAAGTRSLLPSLGRSGRGAETGQQQDDA